MPSSKTGWHCFLPVFAALFLASGCAHIPLTGTELFPVKSEQDELRETVLKDFHQKHDEAQRQAALSHWNRGDVAQCQSILFQLLEKNPEDIESRRILADLYLDIQDMPQHEQHLRILLKYRQDDSQAHHSLALTLQDDNRQQEARKHFQRAVQLNPDNQLYLLSLQTSGELFIDLADKPEKSSVRLSQKR